MCRLPGNDLFILPPRHPTRSSHFLPPPSPRHCFLHVQRSLCTNQGRLLCHVSKRGRSCRRSRYGHKRSWNRKVLRSLPSALLCSSGSSSGGGTVCLRCLLHCCAVLRLCLSLPLKGYELLLLRLLLRLLSKLMSPHGSCCCIKNLTGKGGGAEEGRGWSWKSEREEHDDNDWAGQGKGNGEYRL